MTRPRATTSPSDALGATIADLKARLARMENIAHQHRVLGSHLGLQEVVYFDTVGTDSFVSADYPWLRAARIRVQAGGGGGGGAATTGSGQTSVSSGGTAGTYSESFIAVSSIPASVTVTVGAGGAGGVAATGSAGSPSSFGTLVTTVGGAGGFIRAATAPPHLILANAAASGGVGDLTLAGSPGQYAVSLNATFNNGGNGGASMFGGAGRGTTFASDGDDALGFGSGGGGGANAQNQSTARTGGAGGQGIVIVELYA